MKRITVGQLAKRLNKMVEDGNGRVPVSVAKHTFSHNLEPDGVTIIEVCGIEVEAIPQADDDGGTKCNQDGSESYRRTAVIYGPDWECPKAKAKREREYIGYEFAMLGKTDAATISEWAEKYPGMRREFEAIAIDLLRQQRKAAKP